MRSTLLGLLVPTFLLLDGGCTGGGSSGTTPSFILPDDPAFTNLEQWGLYNLGQDVGVVDGIIGSDIRIIYAWPDAWSGKPVLVALLDSGLFFEHPDLNGSLWENQDEQAGNGLDDDGNGLIDDLHGWNFLENNADLTDRVGHGTHVAGIIGAGVNNGIGIAGVVPRVRLLPLKVFDRYGSSEELGAVTDDAHYLRALHYAIEMGARVINNSWGGIPSSSQVGAFLDDHPETVFVFAAGNRNHDLEAFPYYPASFPCKTCLVVAAGNNRDELWSLSNYGAVSVDIAAPGYEIRSTLSGVEGRYYGELSWTSQAAAFVSGAAALLWSVQPTATAAEICAALLEGADRVPGLQGKVVAGRLNVTSALHR